jgi:hypothetical protein
VAQHAALSPQEASDFLTILELIDAYFNSQSAGRWTVSGRWGVSYCMAHRLTVSGTDRSLMVVAIRYLDAFAKQDGAGSSAEENCRSIGLKTVPLRRPAPSSVLTLM